MTITLYHANPSANSERVRLVLSEKRLPYVSILLVLARREQKTPTFLKLNPHGKVPVIDDEGRVLFESCIINEYLDEQYPDPSLMPADAYRRGRGRVLVDYALSYLQEPYWALRNEMYVPANERDEEKIAATRKTLQDLSLYLENTLEDQTYFLGEFSLVDINVWPRISRMQEFGALPRTQFPNLFRWVKLMQERPSVQMLGLPPPSSLSFIQAFGVTAAADAEANSS